jgi:hypothetical protein
LRAVAALALVCVALNWATTGGSLLRGVLGVDLALLAFGGAAWLAARRIGMPGREAGHG